MWSYKDKVLKKIIEYVRTNYTYINLSDMMQGNIIYNYRCHLNSVQCVKEGKADEVYLCVYVENNYPIVHFINKQGDKFVDNTLGWTYENIDYYIIRKINSDEYKNITDILVQAQRTLTRLYTNTFTRWLFGIKINNFV
ncbi:hypothetical protein [Clostridium beijerinckii]|uniref:hypothetical protein n=2 Tax=Bacteria TaxID=2 RepID=UPI0013617BC3|nr:hypothetical protein [Clostridium beijerinckii]MZK53347.1 hypothetical protein [Clostridium beijerinckii]MZK61452.1 hypothetical protein [Clostridium beijerinckii]MZK71694.1 hypothetical protein [Clostridium beijerinckii]MZK77087.1 hypothetical protein [Clostridium beijerinckii]MZK86742.1 hypothetical protein [Clostridium beijerinckii]